MDNELIRRWIEAGKCIAIDPEAKVLCPVCQIGYLRVTDVTNDHNPSEFERHMKCDHCGAYNALLLSR